MIKKKLLLYSCIIILLSNASCTKKPFTDVSENSSPSVSNAQTYQNPYGLLVSETYGDPDGKRHFLSPTDAANLCHSVGVAYARIAVSNTQWAAKSSRNKFLSEYRAYTLSIPSIKVLLNVNWGSHPDGGYPFPGASPNYKAFIKDLTDTLTSAGYVPPAVMVIENEENNPQFHVVNTHADMDKYIQMLIFCIKECHSKNLKVTNGGLTHFAVNLKIYDYYLNDLHDTARADDYIHTVFPDSLISIMNDPYVSKVRFRSLYYFANYSQLHLDYVNIHWYEPVKLAYWYDTSHPVGIDTNHVTPGAIGKMKAFFNDPNAVGGHQLIVNELGSINPATELPQESTCAMQDIPYVVYYSGDRDQSRGIRPFRQYALHNTYTTGNPAYTLRATGIAFRDNIANIIANPYVFCAPANPGR